MDLEIKSPWIIQVESLIQPQTHGHAVGRGTDTGNYQVKMKARLGCNYEVCEQPPNTERGEVSLPNTSRVEWSPSTTLITGFWTTKLREWVSPALSHSRGVACYSSPRKLIHRCWVKRPVKCWVCSVCKPTLRLQKLDVKAPGVTRLYISSSVELRSSHLRENLTTSETAIKQLDHVLWICVTHPWNQSNLF